MNVRLFFVVVGQFSALSPWPAAPEIPITAKMLLFSNWTPHRLGHQSVSFSFSHTEKKKKKANFFFFFSLLVRWGRKNIALQLTSNQIALGFHSLCPHSICTSHHGPTQISHPAWVILASSPQQIVPLAQHAACACANAHFVIRQAWSCGYGAAANHFICSKCGFNDILHAPMLFFANLWDGLGRSVPVMLVSVWHFEQKTAIITGRDLFIRKPDL